MTDARAHGGKVLTGGSRIGNRGFFFAPTVVTDIPDDSRLMAEEPFGPVAPIIPFRDSDEVIERANAVPFGLSAYAFTRSSARAAAMTEGLEAGLVCINTFTGVLSDTLFGDASRHPRHRFRRCPMRHIRLNPGLPSGLFIIIVDVLSRA